MKHLNHTCLMCRKSCVNRTAKTRRSLRQNKECANVMKAWKDECATATCEVLFGEKSGQFVNYFQIANYCSSCQQLVRDISFTWKKIQCFQKRLEGLSNKMINKLKINHQLVKDKSQSDVLENRISLLLNTAVPFRLEKYTYEEMIEVIYSVAVNNSKLHSGIQNPNQSEDSPLTAEVKQEEISDSEGFLQDELSNSMSFDEDVDEKPEIKSELSEEVSGSLRRNNLKNRKVYNDPKHGTHSKRASSHRKIRPSETARKKRKLFQKSFCTRKSEWTKTLMYTKRYKFICSEENCGKRFAMEETMKIHILKVHKGESKPFKCEQCLTRFTYEHHLTRHVKRMHEKSKSVRNNDCSFCGKKFLTTKDLDLHYSSFHKEPNPFQCAFCSEMYLTSDYLKRHVKDCHLNSQKCNVCDITFSSLNSLKEHERNTHESNNSASSNYCSICDKTFAKSSYFTVHMEMHNLPKVVVKCNFECKFCSKGYLEEHDLNVHYSEAHQDPNPFACAFCPEICTNSVDLSKHMESVHSDPTDPSKICKPKRVSCRCSVCGRRYVSVSLLNEHMKEHKLSDFEKCEICGKCFTTSFSLGVHKRSMHREGGYPCTICGIVFLNAYILKNHNESTHPENLKRKSIRPTKKIQKTTPEMKYGFECKYCSKGYLEEQDLNLHYSEAHQSPNPFTCPYCQEMYTNSMHLNKHMESAHSDPAASPKKCQRKKRVPKQIQTTMPPLKYNFECKFCSKGFVEEKEMNSHYSEAHQGPNPFTCAYCPQIYSNSVDLSRHMDSTHPDPNRLAGKVKCETCGKYYANQKSLYYHSLSHLDPNLLFKCHLCPSIFTMRCFLNYHLDTHDGERKFVCETCGKSYKSASCLRQHARMHDESKRKWKCKICDKKFFKKVHCQHHERTHTDLKDYVCHLCGKSFNRDCNLGEHLKLHAGVPTSRKKKAESTNDSKLAVETSETVKLPSFSNCFT